MGENTEIGGFGLIPVCFHEKNTKNDLKKKQIKPVFG